MSLNTKLLSSHTTQELGRTFAFVPATHTRTAAVEQRTVAQVVWPSEGVDRLAANFPATTSSDDWL